ncbi:MAG TPA: hypothetical protein VGH19_12865 [Verrucomicrobiae bacterium]
MEMDHTAQTGEVYREQKHSALGIASFVLSMLVGISFVALIVIAGILESSRPGGMDENSPVAIFLGLGLFVILGMNLLALGIGIGGLFQQDRKKLFSILGIVFSCLTLLGGGGLLLLGSMVD